MSELVRIKKIKTGEYKMVTPAFASRTKMLKNSGWIVENLPEIKGGVSEKLIVKNDQSEKPDTFDEALTEKETWLSLDEQPEDDNIPLSAKVSQEEVNEPKKRGRQPGSKNKTK